TGLEEALERTLRLGRGAAIALTDGAERLYSERLFCAGCGLGFEALDPRLFSFNSRQGACPDCQGTGITVEIDATAVVDPSRSVDGGALRPLERPELRTEKRRLLRSLSAARVPTDRPFARLTARQRQLVLEGRPGRPGLLAVLREALVEAEGADVDEFTR